MFTSNCINKLSLKVKMKNFCYLLLLFLMVPFNELKAQKEEILNILEKKRVSLNTKESASINGLFHEKATILLFPKQKIAKGIEDISSYYQELFSKHKTLSIELLDRISFKGTVIDKELVKTDTETVERIVFYKFKKGKIKSMTILPADKAGKSINATQIIDVQLAAYNSGNIEAFIKTHTKDVKVYNFPGRLKTSGRSELKLEYSELFKSIPDLHCKIEKRLVMGSIIIDYELIQTNASLIKAIAIYEVKNGLINRVSFID